MHLSPATSGAYDHLLGGGIQMVHVEPTSTQSGEDDYPTRRAGAEARHDLNRKHVYFRVFQAGQIP